MLAHDGTAEPLRVSPPEAVAYLLESKGQNFHDSLLDPTFLIVATNLKAPIY